jgi:hypothetical protein
LKFAGANESDNINGNMITAQLFLAEYFLFGKFSMTGFAHSLRMIFIIQVEILCFFFAQHHLL